MSAHRDVSFTLYDSIKPIRFVHFLCRFLSAKVNWILWLLLCKWLRVFISAALHLGTMRIAPIMEHSNPPLEFVILQNVIFNAKLKGAASEFQEHRQQQRRSLIHILCGIVALFSFGNFVVSFHSPRSIEWQRRLWSRNGKSLKASTALIMFVLLLSFQQRTLIKELSGELVKLNSIRTQNDNFSG